MSDSNFLILSCDGGGIRGLITAMIIQQIDQQTGFLDKVDLFAGTSTGGIIALALASGLPISKIVGLYSNNCSQIFTPYIPPNSGDQDVQNDLNSIDNTLNSIDNFLQNDIPGILQGSSVVQGIESDVQSLENDVNNAKNALNDLNNLFYAKYDNTGLQSVLQSNLSNPAQTLASLQRAVMVATFQLDNTSNSSWQPITLDNLKNNSINSQNSKILDAALCTSAAPTFFPPYQHPTYGYCVDGGVFANNPSTLALSRVVKAGIANLEDIRMLSIGTGMNQYNISPSYQPAGSLRYGATTWLWPKAVGETPAVPLVQILMDSSSILDDSQANMFLGDQQYQRMNIQLTGNISLDDCSQISNMESQVKKYLGESEFSQAIDWIKTNFL